MSMQDTLNRFDEIHEKFKNVKTVEERQAVETEWWANALGAFNEHIAGTITLSDGSTHTIPTIDL